MYQIVILLMLALFAGGLAPATQTTTSSNDGQVSTMADPIPTKPPGGGCSGCGSGGGGGSSF